MEKKRVLPVSRSNADRDFRRDCCYRDYCSNDPTHFGCYRCYFRRCDPDRRRFFPRDLPHYDRASLRCFPICCPWTAAQNRA